MSFEGLREKLNALETELSSLQQQRDMAEKARSAGADPSVFDSMIQGVQAEIQAVQQSIRDLGGPLSKRKFDLFAARLKDEKTQRRTRNLLRRVLETSGLSSQTKMMLRGDLLLGELRDTQIVMMTWLQFIKERHANDRSDGWRFLRIFWIYDLKFDYLFSKMLQDDEISRLYKLVQRNLTQKLVLANMNEARRRRLPVRYLSSAFCNRGGAFGKEARSLALERVRPAFAALGVHVASHFYLPRRKLQSDPDALFQECKNHSLSLVDMDNSYHAIGALFYTNPNPDRPHTLLVLNSNGPDEVKDDIDSGFSQEWRTKFNVQVLCLPDDFPELPQTKFNFQRNDTQRTGGEGECQDWSLMIPFAFAKKYPATSNFAQNSVADMLTKAFAFYQEFDEFAESLSAYTQLQREVGLIGGQFPVMLSLVDFFLRL